MFGLKNSEYLEYDPKDDEEYPVFGYDYQRIEEHIQKKIDGVLDIRQQLKYTEGYLCRLWFDYSERDIIEAGRVYGRLEQVVRELKIKISVNSALVAGNANAKEKEIITPCVNRSTHARVGGINKERFSAKDSEFAKLFIQYSKGNNKAALPAKKYLELLIEYHRKKEFDPQKPKPANGLLPKTPEELVEQYHEIE